MGCCGNNIFSGMWAQFQSAVQTAFAPIPEDSTHVAIAATNVQDAIDIVSTEIKSLEDKNRPYAKEGDAQATNSEDVLVTDKIFHTGDTIIGDNGSLMPFDIRYKHQIYGNEKISRYQELQNSFNNNDGLFSALLITLDLLAGDDSKDNHEYISPNTPISLISFLTWNRMCQFINSFDTNKYFYVRIINSSAANRIAIGTGLGILLHRKNIIFVGTPTAPAYFTIPTTINLSYATRSFFFYCDFTASADQAITIGDGSWVELGDTKITYAGGVEARLFSLGTGNLILDSGTVINMTGNGSVVFGNNNANIASRVDIGYNVGINGIIGAKIDAGAATGVTLTTGRDIDIRVRRPSELQLVGLIDTLNAKFLLVKGQAWGITQANYTDANLDSTMSGATLSLHGSKPLWFQNLNANSANGAFVTRKALYVDENGIVIVG